MLELNDAMNRVEIALQHSRADQTEVILGTKAHGLTRMAGNRIHQNIAISDNWTQVRAVVGKRVGVARANRLGGDDLRALVEQATAIARVAEPNPDFHSLPGADETPTPAPAPAVTPEHLSPERRAASAKTVVHTATGNGVSASGHISTAFSALAVGNSLGIRSFTQQVQAGVMAIMTRDSASGYAMWSGRTLDEAPVAAVAGRASSKCLAGQDPIAIEPGAYTVVLEPAAVAEMLVMLAVMGLGATAYQEGRSFMAGKIGQQLVGENITLSDDTYHAMMPTFPFDYEGVPRRRVPFFERGVAQGVVYDSYTAQKENRPSTGHALPAPSTQGPIPLHLVLNGGNTATEDLVAGIERGILVTRFHYVNVVHPKETIITGMTRDGTFLIEGGSVTRPIKNMRFTQNILEALRRVTALERAQTLLDMEGIYCLVPSLRIEEFNFTSVTG